MPQQDRLINLCLPEPRRFVSGEEDLDCYLLSSPLPQPNLPVAALTDTVNQLDLLGYCPLNLKWKPE